MKEEKSAERFGDMKLITIKIRDLPADNMDKSVERRRSKPKATARILAIVRFLFVPLRSFFSTTLAKRLKAQCRQGLYNLVLLIRKRHKK